MFVRRIEIEKQKIEELPLVVQITPRKSDQPQLLIIEIRLPDQQTQSFNSHYIPYSWTPASSSTNTQGSVYGAPHQAASPVQQALPFRNGQLAPFQGTVSVGAYPSGGQPAINVVSMTALQSGGMLSSTHDCFFFK